MSREDAQDQIKSKNVKEQLANIGSPGKKTLK